MNNHLRSAPPSLDSAEPFGERMRKDCVLDGDDGMRETMVAFNWLLAYVAALEARVAELEKRES